MAALRDPIVAHMLYTRSFKQICATITAHIFVNCACSEVIHGRMDRKTAAAHIATWVQEHITHADREHFREMAESELLGLHEGNYARYEVRPAEFTAWRGVWTETAT
jgi:hypothetical protein